MQPHPVGLKNTEWQSILASHAASVVTFTHGAGIKGHAVVGQATASLGPTQAVNFWPPLQSVQ